MLAQLLCLQLACQELQIPVQTLDQNGNFLQINLTKGLSQLELSSLVSKPQKPKADNSNFYFVNSQTPFNNQDISTVCKDKFFAYNLLKRVVPQPQTWNFLDPFCANYREYRECQSFEQIAEFITKNLKFPLIIKPNSGSLGTNVQKINKLDELQVAISKIFDSHSRDYDYVLLAQEYIEIKIEFRVVVVNNLVELVYQKDNSQAEFVGNLSPLHWHRAQVKVLDKNQANFKLWQRLQVLVDRIIPILTLNWAGLDVALNEQGELIVIEINTNPGFSLFLQSETEHFQNLVQNSKIAKTHLQHQDLNVKVLPTHFTQSATKQSNSKNSEQNLLTGLLDVAKNPQASNFKKTPTKTEFKWFQFNENLANYPKHRMLVKLYTLALTKLQKSYLSSLC